MVLVKMLMEIDPLSMRGSLVMTMASISPSGREVSPAEQLRRSPRLVLPKFRLETAALRPESSLMIFFPGQNPPYSRRWAPEGCQGAHKPQGRAQGGRARPPGLWPPGGSPLVFLPPNIFYIFQNNSPENFSSFGVVQNRYLDGAFSGPEFQLPVFSLLV